MTTDKQPERDWFIDLLTVAALSVVVMLSVAFLIIAGAMVLGFLLT